MIPSPLERVRSAFALRTSASPQAPAVAAPSHLRALAAYLGFFALTLALTIGAFRLDKADFRVPFSIDWDVKLILPLVKSTVETGTWWENARLGAPGIQELYDFPIVDVLHFALIRSMGGVISDPIVIFNLYYVLTYPLVAIAAMFVGRRFGLSLPAAGAAGVLFAFLPYHYQRHEMHYFLSAYFVVPFTLMLVLRVCQGRLPFCRANPDGSYRWALWSGESLTAVAIALATAVAGAYYAFFGCALLAAAGCYGWVAVKTWKAFASASLLVILVVGGLIACHAPAIVYEYRNGNNSSIIARAPEEAETFGLKLTHLILPTKEHNSRWMRAHQDTYNAPYRPLQTENTSATLGLVGSAGFLVLLTLGILPGRWKGVLGPLSFLTVFAFLVATIGGIGSFFNYAITPQVRAYNRISIYMAFLAFLAAFWLVERALAGWPRGLRWTALVVVAGFGLWDETDKSMFKRNATDQWEVAKVKYHQDAAFFEEVERRVPNGSVFTLPMLSYPETHEVGSLDGYSHVRGYLHTKTVRWSFGAMRGREVDQWQSEVSAAPTAEQLRRLALKGFEGLFFDRRGYGNAEANNRLAEIRSILGDRAQPFAHVDGQQFFFDLRRYRDDLRARLGSDAFDAAARADSDAVRILWLGGFYGSPLHECWCGPKGLAVIVNPTDRARTLKLDMRMTTQFSGYSQVTIDGGSLWSETIPVNNHTNEPIPRSLVVPPGRHLVKFQCRPSDDYRPWNTRKIVFAISHLQLSEEKPKQE